MINHQQLNRQLTTLLDDINILETALSSPTIPLPTAATLPQNVSIISNFFNKLSSVNWSDIYAANESPTYSKYSKEFHTDLNSHMDQSIQGDAKLAILINELIDEEIQQEILIESNRDSRFIQIKKFFVQYYQNENSKNLPSFKSINLLRMSYITIILLFRKIFPDGIWVNKDQFQTIVTAYSANPKSIIFTPNHTSHIDYMIIHLILIRFQMNVPMVIAGDNLNLAVFGYLLKNLGAIFIKRNFSDEPYTATNHLNMIEFILKRNMHLEVFIEGARSRNGKIMLPKYGILKNVLSVLESNENLEVSFQPLNIKYEKVYEIDGYINELMGNDKKPESMGRIILNGAKNFLGNEKINIGTKKKNFGKIFVTLGQQIKVSSKDAPNIKLKELGYDILRETNNVSYYTDISIICLGIQLHNYLIQSKKFHVDELIIILKFLVIEIRTNDIKVNRFNNNLLNLDKWDKILKDKQETINIIRYTMGKFLNDIKFERDYILVNSSIELLYYKNSVLHLFIEKIIVSFIIVNFSTDISQIDSYFQKITHLLTSEFLLDETDYIKVLNELQDSKVISIVDGRVKVLDKRYLKRYSILMVPFLESYNLIISTIYKEISNTKQIEFKRLIKIIHKDTSSQINLRFNLESFNKQTILNFIFQLQSLGLIKINKTLKGNIIDVLDFDELDKLFKFINFDYFDIYDHNLKQFRSKL